MVLSKIRRIISFALIPKDGLGAQVLRGSILQFISKFGLRALKFIRTLILARLLFPEDFGLFVLASVCMGLVDTFAQSGFQNALVQRDVVERKHLDGAWTLHVSRGFFLGALMFFSAPYLAIFFNEQKLTDIIRVLSLSLVLDGFVNMGAVLLQKNFEFGKKLLYDFSYNLAEMIGSVIGALYFRNVWALVVGVLAGKIAAVVFSYVFHKYRPRITLDFEGARELFRFGKWVSLGGVIAFFVSRGDGIVIGKLASTEALGYYQLAFSLALLPALEVMRSLGVVFFPMFARLKDTPEQLRSVFVRTSSMMSLFVLPMTAGLLVLAHPIVLLLYGDQWLPMVPVLQILLAYGLLKSVEYLVTPVLLGLGKPKQLTYASAVHAVILFATIIPLTMWYGIEGAAMSLLAAACASTGMLLVVFARSVSLSGSDIAAVVAVPVLASMGMSALLAGLDYAVPIHSVIHLVGIVMLGVMVYAAMVFVCDKMQGGTIRLSLRWMRAQI